VINHGLTEQPGQDLLVAVLGICPLLIVTTSVVTGLSLGFICLITMVFTQMIISGLRNFISFELRLIVILLIVATVVSILHAGLQVWFFELSLLLDIYIPLIAVNCVILASAEEFSLSNNVPQSFLHGLKQGMSLMIVLFIIGTIREIIGSGTLLDNADLIFGDRANVWQIILFAGDFKFILFKLAPGAFLIFGFFLAAVNFFNSRSGKPVVL